MSFLRKRNQNSWLFFFFFQMNVCCAKRVEVCSCTARRFADLWSQHQTCQTDSSQPSLIKILICNLILKKKTHSFHFIILYLLDRWPQDNSIWQFRNDSIMMGVGGGGCRTGGEAEMLCKLVLAMHALFHCSVSKHANFLLHLFFFSFLFFFEQLFSTVCKLLDNAQQHV